MKESAPTIRSQIAKKLASTRSVVPFAIRRLRSVSIVRTHPVPLVLNSALIPGIGMLELCVSVHARKMRATRRVSQRRKSFRPNSPFSRLFIREFLREALKKHPRYEQKELEEVE